MIWLALIGILGIILVQVVTFSLLTMAKRDDDDFWRLAGKLLEDDCHEDQQSLVGKVQMTRPTGELNKNGLEIARRASA